MSMELYPWVNFNLWGMFRTVYQIFYFPQLGTICSPAPWCDHSDQYLIQEDIEKYENVGI